jgi:hypothetical protein
MRPFPLLLLGAAAGCAHYAKLQNPSPLEDLEASVRLESLAHARIKAEIANTINLRVRIEVPRDATVSLGDTVAVVFDPSTPDRVIGYGTFREDGVAGGPTQVFTSATTARLNIPVRGLPGSELRSGIAYRIQLRWLQRSGPRDRFEPRQSRRYEIRVQRVSFGPMIAIGIIPLGVLGVVLSR